MKLVAVALLLGMAGAAPASAAQASASTAVVPTGVEAWYHITPEPLEGVPALNPYGEDTLHAGIRAGMETARTYITLDLGSIPQAATISGAVLTLPVDVVGGTTLPETAAIDVCFAPDPGQSVEGSWEEPPHIDCSTSARAQYTQTPEPQFTVDLAALTGRLRSWGLVIMASEEAVSDAATWHVAIYGKENATDGARPITADVSYQLPLPDPGPAPGPIVFAPDPGLGFLGAVPEVTSPFAVPDPRLPAFVPQPEPPAPVGTTDVNFGLPTPDYLSWILLLPLILLLFVGYFSGALVHEDDQ